MTIARPPVPLLGACVSASPLAAFVVFRLGLRPRPPAAAHPPVAGAAHGTSVSAHAACGGHGLMTMTVVALAQHLSSSEERRFHPRPSGTQHKAHTAAPPTPAPAAWQQGYQHGQAGASFAQTEKEGWKKGKEEGERYRGKRKGTPKPKNKKKKEERAELTKHDSKSVINTMQAPLIRAAHSNTHTLTQTLSHSLKHSHAHTHTHTHTRRERKNGGSTASFAINQEPGLGCSDATYKVGQNAPTPQITA